MSEITTKYSVKLSKVLEKKITGGLLRRLRKNTFWHGILAKGDADNVFRMVGAMNRAGGIARSFTFGTAPKTVRRDWVFLFDSDESSAIEFVETKIVRGKVPRKILIRMVVDRLAKTGGRYNIAVTRELLTPEGFELARSEWWMNDEGFDRPGCTPWQLQEIEYLLNRDEMTLEIFDEAWDLWKVRKIMAA